jgi:hypothetical protein
MSKNVESLYDNVLCDIFKTICHAMPQEEGRIKGLVTGRHSLEGITGNLVALSEAHLVHVIARELDIKGYKTIIDDPYILKDGNYLRFDLKIALDAPENTIDTRFLTLEVKRWITNFYDNSFKPYPKFKRMLDDIRKIRKAISRSLVWNINLPVGLLLIIFSQFHRDNWLIGCLNDFSRRAKIETWKHFQEDIKLPTKGEFSFCLVDLWITTSDI